MNDFLESTSQAASDAVNQAKQAATEAADKAKQTASHLAEKAEAACESTTNQVENLVKKHPVWSVLATVGVGFAVGVLVRELLTPPPPPKNRALQVLEDIQARLSGVAKPAYERASHYAEEGVNAVRDGVSSLGNSRLVSRIRNMFS
jgi:ElaB/YqjD/DUF883 family membrane-anchored ribosome-binding protein